MQLHYTENVPDDFESPGFIPASDTVLRIDNDRGWFMADTAFGDFKTNDHKYVMALGFYLIILIIKVFLL